MIRLRIDSLLASTLHAVRLFPGLRFVQVRGVAPQSYVVEATDGKWLTQWRDAAVEPHHEDGAAVRWQRSAIPTLVAWLSVQEATIVDVDLETGRLASAETWAAPAIHESHYPDINAVLLTDAAWRALLMPVLP